MFGIQMNPNAIYVAYIRTGCCIGEFDSTYPNSLNGIISPDEYQKSIEKINCTVMSNRVMKILVILSTLITIIGIILFVTGSKTNDSDSDMDGFPMIFSIALGLGLGGPFFFLIGWFIQNIRRTEQIQKAVEEESKKYSSRSPIACRWRLQASNICVGRWGDNSQFHYCIVMRTGPPARRRGNSRVSNQHPNESSYLIE